ncbi:helix-turn-helix domain-containing protein [Fluviicola sp.]|uniref:helix-turn-helix domain-containing protein n=1 Tax=Fluviicola sp. TaxID=1917219 RepID=UPI003D2DAFAB
MQKDNIQTIKIESITQSHQALGIEKPKHPLFSVLRFEDLKQVPNDSRVRLVFDFYQITLKKDCPGKLQYGQTPFDFDEGVMAFFAPKQVSILEKSDEILAKSGWLLNIHPDFLRSFSLGQKIREYSFFEYEVNEALILSEEEEKSIETIFQQIEKEYKLPIDIFSHDVVIANIELLLTYCNRYYNRQFILRKPNNQSLLVRFKNLLNEYFENGLAQKGLPSVTYLAEKLNLSPKYLSDCIKNISGQNTQQHIHDIIIEKAKELLSSTDLTVSEVAYQLGFEYSQSFSKLFKSKSGVSPLEFRSSFN